MIRFFLAIFDFVVGGALLGVYGAWVFDAWQKAPAETEKVSHILRLIFVFPFRESMAAYVLVFGLIAVAFGVLAVRSGPLILRRSAGEPK